MNWPCLTLPSIVKVEGPTKLLMLSRCPHNDSKVMTDSDSDEIEVISYSTVCEMVDLCLDTTKIPYDLKKETLSIGSTV